VRRLLGGAGIHVVDEDGTVAAWLGVDGTLFDNFDFHSNTLSAR
jgi:hypothetical protein